jgi:hypothetical protein
MTSYQQFTPGKKSNSKKIIQYIAEYNAIFAKNANVQPLNCVCVQDKFDKNLSNSGSDSASERVSNSTRLAHLVNNKRGGKTQYGNFYLGQPLNVNYLGRMEGMPGGSGTPPKNIFH